MPVSCSSSCIPQVYVFSLSSGIKTEPWLGCPIPQYQTLHSIWAVLLFLPYIVCCCRLFLAPFLLASDPLWYDSCSETHRSLLFGNAHKWRAAARGEGALYYHTGKERKMRCGEGGGKHRHNASCGFQDSSQGVFPSCCPASLFSVCGYEEGVLSNK